jgi:hypothetical protein
VNFHDFGDSVIFSLDGGISWHDSAVFVALARAFEILGSWISCRKTPVGTMARLEPSLTNSSTISFFLTRYASTRDHRNCFLTCGAPGNTKAFFLSRHNHSLLAWLTMSSESPRTLSRRMLSAVAILRPSSNASYSAALLDAGKCICKAYLKLFPLGDVTRISAPVP